MNVCGKWNPMLCIENVKHLVEIGQNGSIVVTHQVRKMIPKYGCSFFQMVVGDFGKQMVDLVGANIVDQIMGPAIMPIHGT